MAGALLHLAMGDPEILDPENAEYSASFKRSYALGLLLPDIAKQGMIADAHALSRYFDGCSIDDMPTYEAYHLFRQNHHFNPDRQNPSIQDTRNPNLNAFLNAGYTDLRKPVWQGVLCHLMGDKAFYFQSCCTDGERATRDFASEVGELYGWDRELWRNSNTGQLYYSDYDVLNRCVEDTYHVLENVSRYLSASLLDELLANFHVRFSADRSQPVYMNWNMIQAYITQSRRLIHGIGLALHPEDRLQFFEPHSLEAFFKEIR